MDRAGHWPEDAYLEPARLRAEDARTLIEFAVCDLEVRRGDWLQDVHLTIEVDAPAPRTVPAGGGGNRWTIGPATAPEAVT